MQPGGARSRECLRALGNADLDGILCHEEVRVVARANTVSLARPVLQIAPQPGRRTCVGVTVTVRQHLDGRYTISRGAQPWGTFRADGRRWTLLPWRRHAPGVAHTENAWPSPSTGNTLTKAD
jgi:hypothetical protein